ncbi:MAG TPA: zf-TFIIB domain-containing protein [Azospirillum sp.]
MCPNCHSGMKEVERNGVHIDMCPQCRGVWLDRGELEKLLEPIRQADHEYVQGYDAQGHRQHPQGQPPQGQPSFLPPGLLSELPAQLSGPPRSSPSQKAKEPMEGDPGHLRLTSPPGTRETLAAIGMRAR